MTVKCRIPRGNLSVIGVYVTEDGQPEATEIFYNDLQRFLNKTKVSI
jgi:hypothetical protein